MRQDKASVADAGALSGVDYIPIAVQPPGIAGFGLAVLTRLAAGVHCLAELKEDALRRLCGQPGIAAICPALAMMLSYQVISKARPRCDWRRK
jgi:hypothetical protein